MHAHVIAGLQRSGQALHAITLLAERAFSLFMLAWPAPKARVALGRENQRKTSAVISLVLVLASASASALASARALGRNIRTLLHIMFRWAWY